MKLAILGLGRSGVSAAKAAIRHGDEPTVYDDTPAEEPKRQAAKQELLGMGVVVKDGWEGGFQESVVITSPGVPRDNERLIAALAEGKEVISEVEYAYRISKAPIVAITGTNGKSTTTVMTYLAAKGAGHQAILCGNIYGSGYEEIPLSEAAADSTPDQVLVAEISSFQLEWVRDFKPVVAGITNIGWDHLDRYRSRSEYAAAKQRIFEAQGPDDYAVVNADDLVVRTPVGPKVLFFGSEGEHARVMDDRMVVLGQSIDYASLPFHERHNYLNACMALLLVSGLVANRRKKEPILPPGAIEGLRQFKGLSHRMELVGEKNGVKVINNSMCTNVEAIFSSARSVPGIKHLLMGGINKGLDFRPLAGFLQATHGKAYLYGRAREEINGMLGGGWQTFESMQDAFQAATKAAKSGEVILLAPGCSSFDQFEDFRQRGNVYKQIAKDWLNS